MKTRILSDLHLGHSASRIEDCEMLEPLLEGVDHLILAGDVWQERIAGERVTNAGILFAQLKKMVHDRNLSVEILRGNHDPGTPQGVAWCADRVVLVTHGDAVYDEATPWSREFGYYREEIRKIVDRYEPQSHLAQACSDRACEIANTIQPRKLPKLPVPFNFFATALWPPSRTFEMIRAWRTMGREGLRFLKKSGEGAKVLVCGHFHRAGIWEDGEHVAINTGSFMKGSKPWLVDVEGAEVIARAIDLDEGMFVEGEVKGRFGIA